jgi:hypothetical protein
MTADDLSPDERAADRKLYVDKAIAEIDKMLADAGKLRAEQFKMQAEQLKLNQESFKLSREGMFYPILAVGACLGAGVALGKIIFGP